MKKGLLILLCLPMIGFGQTLIPDADFEQALINLGYDTGTPNGSVSTANINTITDLNVSNQDISDLTGIESFTALTVLDCGFNQLTSLDLSQNTALTSLSCYYNQITSLDVSNNITLTDLICWGNQLTNLDVSQNTALTKLACNANQLINLDLRNGNNTNIQVLYSFDNPNLFCIDVDDASWSNTNWTACNPPCFDTTMSFSENCSLPSAIQEYATNKELLKVTGLLGRGTKGKKNEPLFYIYNDGTVEKRIIIE